MGEAGEWLRARGIGRERFAGYVEQYLQSLGYEVTRTELTDPSATRLAGVLKRMNPAVPLSASELRFRIGPTSGGGTVFWEAPLNVPNEERSRMDRFVREFTQHVERTVLTESHGTAKVSRAPESPLPWESRPNGGVP
ncbi:MAG TPA: hypothetical protein VJS68_02330 [Thermoplasmata archaeon]|nr:hypothetical protein [Thermoplasmata archaeon]